jgi:hypothetical protein
MQSTPSTPEVPINVKALALPFLLAGTVQATDFGPLMEVARTTWPKKARLCVVANYRHSQEDILALAWEAGSGSTLTVIDVTHPDQIGRAGHLITFWKKPDFIVLLPKDPLVRDGSPWATRLLSTAVITGIPTIGTTRKAVRQGAVFAIGPDTGLNVLVTEKLIGTVSVELPPKGFTPTAALGGRSMAQVTVVGAFH